MLGRVLLVAALFTVALGAVVLPPHVGATVDNLSIAGTIWQDANIDGIRQPDERGLRIINVSLFKDGVEMSRIQPDDQGRYSFAGLDPGPYTVRLIQAPDSFFWTYPNRRATGPYETTVNLTGVSVDTVDFGLTLLEGLPRFNGAAWIDGRPAVGADVRAYVDGVDCTAGNLKLFPELMPTSSWTLRVLSSAFRPGCGEKGKPISFTVNGRPAFLTLNQVTAIAPIWDAGASGGGHLVVGPPFSTFEAFTVTIDVDGDRKPSPHPGAIVEAFVGGVRCGRLVMLGMGAEYLTIASSQLQPGCAVAGSPISFTVNGMPALSEHFSQAFANDVTTEPWLEGVRGETLLLHPAVLTLVPPTTGDAGLR